MRRLLVIFLIFLFPLQVFADYADYPPLDAPAPVVAVQAKQAAAAADAGFFDTLIAMLCGDNGYDQPPAHLDLANALFHDVSFVLADCSVCALAPYVPAADYQTFLPLIKPPPQFAVLSA